MKKLIKFTAAFIAAVASMALLSLSASAFDVSDNIDRFSVVDEYNGRLYCAYDKRVYGGTNEDICSMLPYGMHDIGHIKSFTIHNGYIYYLTSSSSVYGNSKSEIYRCNMDGTNNVYIADNALSNSECYIVNDTLYYETGSPKEYYYDGIFYTYDGIAKINLNTCEYEKIYNEGAYLTHCTENYVFFSNTDYYNLKCYRLNTDGTNLCTMSENDIELAPGVIHYSNRYYAYDGGIYIYDWKGNSTWFANDARQIQINSYKTLYPSAYDTRSIVVAVIDGYVYYTEEFSLGRGQHKLGTPNKYLFRTNGLTNNELVGWRYVE